MARFEARAIRGCGGLGVGRGRFNRSNVAGRCGRCGAAAVFRARAAFALRRGAGDARVRRGARQMVWVTTELTNASKAIQWRTAGGDWQTAPLLPGKTGDVFAHQLRDLYADTEYQVQVGAHRSNVYRLSVWTPPEVVSISLLYRYPDYLEMADREVLFGGDIAAPQGSEVVVQVTVNKALEKASLVLGDGEELALKNTGDAVWEGTLSITKNDTYEVALQDAEGEQNEMARTYKIAGKADHPPRIRIRFPKGDDEATAIEEVAFGFSIKDDYGIADYGLQYEAAGRAPVRISLKKEAKRVGKRRGRASPVIGRPASRGGRFCDVDGLGRRWQARAICGRDRGAIPIFWKFDLLNAAIAKPSAMRASRGRVGNRVDPKAKSR